MASFRREIHLKSLFDVNLSTYLMCGKLQIASKILCSSCKRYNHVYIGIQDVLCSDINLSTSHQICYIDAKH